MDPHIIVLTVVGWIVPALVTLAINKTLNNPPKDDKAQKLDEEIEKKKRILAQLDEGITSNQIVKHGLWGVKNVISGAKEAIENYQKHDGRRRNVFFCKPDGRTNRLEEALDMLRQTDVDIRAVAVARQQDEEYKFRRTTGERMHSVKLRGRDAETRRLLNWLEKSQRSSSSDSKKFSILSIVGPGGIGKTELAREAYNARAGFGIKAWVSVCENCDVKKLTIEIMDSADIKLPPGLHSINSPEQIRSIFTKRIKGQRVLVVFDDVWEGFSTPWEELYNSLSHGKQGSRVIVTTQLERVAKLIGSDETINLDPLEHQEYRKVFEECAFGNQNPNKYPQLQRLGQAIAAKFEGSPLAAVEIGRRLASDLTEQHWETILGSRFGVVQRASGDILSALAFCYQQLPEHLKKCYLSCALFPKNYSFDKDQLLRLWVALVPSLTDKEIRSLIEDLASRSFFVNAERKKNKFMIHPVLHEFADMISDGVFFRLEKVTEEIKIPEKACHVYVKADILVKVCKGLREKKNLCSLVIDGGLSSGTRNSQSDFYKPLDKVLDDREGLRVLILAELPGKGSLRSIQTLSGLKYLEIPQIENRRLPMTFLKRYHRKPVNVNQVPRDLFIKREGMDALVKLCGMTTADGQPETTGNRRQPRQPAPAGGKRRSERLLARGERNGQPLRDQ